MGVVFFVVAILCGILTPWDVFYLVENQGVGDEGSSILAFVAGYTLPLTFGTGVIAFLFLRGAYRGHGAMPMVVTAAVILAGSGWLAQTLGLGLLPDYTSATGAGSGPWRLLTFVLEAYLNSYGWAPR